MWLTEEEGTQESRRHRAVRTDSWEGHGTGRKVNTQGMGIPSRARGESQHKRSFFCRRQELTCSLAASDFGSERDKPLERGANERPGSAGYGRSQPRRSRGNLWGNHW